MDGFDQRVANAHARFAAVELARAEERAALAANPAQAIPSSLGVRSGGLSSTLVSSLRELEHSQLSRVHQRNLTAGTPRASAAVAGTPRASAVAASCSRAAAAQATVPLPFASAATGTTHSYNVRPGAKPRPESASVRRIVTPSLMARTLSLRSEIANSQLDRAPSGAGLGYTQSATLSAQQQQQSARFAGSYAHSRSRFSSGATSRAGTAASTPRTLGAGSGIPPAGRKKPRPNSAYAISDSKREAERGG
ncbi:hypothetical protein T492DRAFT_880228 [Pavlovales sp. CCMP2436]|nr:hypothetical protein T492DRAFT_880228 [Pavlovales sp. CCMP2436]